MTDKVFAADLHSAILRQFNTLGFNFKSICTNPTGMNLFLRSKKLASFDVSIVYHVTNGKPYNQGLYKVNVRKNFIFPEPSVSKTVADNVGLDQAVSIFNSANLSYARKMMK